jgi:ArsR family transcriptional regulator, arsenate/arsenite/antimonite-responsive transcriptional repressor
MKRELKVIELNTGDTEVCCLPAAAPTLDRTQAEQAANLLAALADPTRLTILNMLLASQGDVCVCDITASFSLGQPTISHHLRILREAGLISGDKRGKWVYYSPVSSNIEKMKALLDNLLAVPALAY